VSDDDGRCVGRKGGVVRWGDIDAAVEEAKRMSWVKASNAGNIPNAQGAAAWKSH
jgi:hypothetical protein